MKIAEIRGTTSNSEALHKHHRDNTELVTHIAGLSHVREVSNSPEWALDHARRQGVSRLKTCLSEHTP